MYKIIGYLECDKDLDTIIFKDDKYYIVNETDKTMEETKKEVLQYVMSNPFDKLRYDCVKKEDEYIASCISIIYDGISYEFIGKGKTECEAVMDMAKNILSIMEDYDEKKVKKIIDEMN